MQHNTYIYIFIMVFVCFLIRARPMLLIQKPIENRFIRSFLHYVPYACLTAMTFPAILSSTENMISGGAALIVAVVLALRGKSLIVVALGSSGAVLLAEFLLRSIF